MIDVRAPSVFFYSPLDEEAFFEWLNNLPCINEVYGEVRDIVLSIDDLSMSDANFHELIAIFRRYNIDRAILRGLINERNESWARDWEPDIFSENQ